MTLSLILSFLAIFVWLIPIISFSRLLKKIKNEELDTKEKEKMWEKNYSILKISAVFAIIFHSLTFLLTFI